MNDLVKIQALLEDKADCQASLNLLPYEGSPEIKEQNGSRYLYVRKRIVSTHLTTLGIYQSSSRGILVHGITNHLSSGYARLHNIILNPIHDRFAVSVVESPFEFRIV